MRAIALLAFVACSSSGLRSADAPIADAPLPDAIPCTADCECLALGAQCCLQGACAFGPGVPIGCGRPHLGICGPGGDCSCAGGTCDSRHCCIVADGGIDPGTGPACRPPEPDAP